MKKTVRTAAPLVVLSAVMVLFGLFFTSEAPSQSTQNAVATPAVAMSAAAEADAAEKLYRQVWQSARDNFLWQDRLADWQKWQTQFAGKLHTRAQAEAAAAEMLASLKDKYTCYRDAAATEALNKLADKRDVVDAQMLAAKVGYIRIRTFSSKHTAVEVEDALRQLSDAKSYVIDLRDNPGGLIEEAHKVFAMLAESGELATLKGVQNGKAYTEQLVVTKNALHDIENGAKLVLARPAYLAGRKPIVVLVNGKTASCAEMLAGALQKLGFRVVGVTTFGKGIAQIVFELANKASVQFTFAEYLLPGGASVQGKGISPDVQVKLGSSGDAQLDAARKELARQLAAAKE